MHFLMFFWFYSILAGWSTWQWVFLNFSINFWSFDTPGTPGCASAVIQNHCLKQIWAIPPTVPPRLLCNPDELLIMKAFRCSQNLLVDRVWDSARFLKSQEARTLSYQLLKRKMSKQNSLSVFYIVQTSDSKFLSQIIFI